MKTPNLIPYKHYGVVQDLTAADAPEGAWSDVGNFQFQEGASLRVGGYAPYADPISVSPLFAFHTTDQSTDYWIYCGQNTVYVTDGTNHYNITPSAGLNVAPAGSWTACSLNGIPVLCNGVNKPFYWDLNTANPCVNLPGWPGTATCRAIASHKFHLIALDITYSSTRYQDTIWWSNAAEPGTLPTTWTPAADNDAGDMILADTPGANLFALSLRDTLIVYKENSTYALQYVGGAFVYTQRKVFLTQGIFAKNCAVEIEGEHWVFTGTDVIRHNGQQSASVVQDKVKNTLIDSVDTTYKDYCCVAAIHSQSQVWVCIPTQGNSSLNKAYVINTKTNDVGVRELPDVLYVGRGLVDTDLYSTQWSTDSQAWELDLTFWNQQTFNPTADSLLMCAYDSQDLWAVDTSDENDGSPVGAYVERESLPISDGVNNKLITRIIPDIRGFDGDVVYVKVGGQCFFGDDISWSAAEPYTIGSSHFVDVETEGRYLSVRFEASTRRKWSIHGYRIQAVDTGVF